MSDPDAYYDPPNDRWGTCPRCGASQEDAERIHSSDLYCCPCGRKYTDEEGYTDPRGDEPHDFNEREGRG